MTPSEPGISRAKFGLAKHRQPLLQTQQQGDALSSTARYLLLETVPAIAIYKHQL